MDKVDLHMHSNVSDGLYSPTKLMKLAGDFNLGAVGLTDHDNIDGLPEAEEAASKHGVELVTGVEISILHEDEEIHILGYYPRKLELLSEALNEIQTERFRGMEKMVDKLKKLSVKVSFDEVLEEAGSAAPGRMHLARLLYNKKYVHTVDEAFSLYLTRNREAYVPRETMTLKQAMALLREVEAVIVAAHPGYNKIDIVGM
ncbi:MAG: PHP domain-containing protein, partial [Bacillota bacterium]